MSHIDLLFNRFISLPKKCTFIFDLLLAIIVVTLIDGSVSGQSQNLELHQIDSWSSQNGLIDDAFLINTYVNDLADESKLKISTNPNDPVNSLHSLNAEQVQAEVQVYKNAKYIELSWMSHVFSPKQSSKGNRVVI